MMDSESGETARNSPAVEAMLAAFNTHQLIAITNQVPNTINIDMLPLARIKRSMLPPDKAKALVPHATSPDAPRSVSC